MNGFSTLLDSRLKPKPERQWSGTCFFADDAGIATHTEKELQHLLDRLSDACKEFGLIISFPKTKILSQGWSVKPSIQIDNYELGVVEDFI